MLVMLAVAAGMFAVAPWMIDAAPYEATMGLVYKIYFFHMPSAWMFLTAAVVAGVVDGSVMVLLCSRGSGLGGSGLAYPGPLRRHTG